MLTVGAALLGAGTVVGVDIDDSAIEVLKDNIEDMELANIDAVLCDFLSPNLLK